MDLIVLFVLLILIIIFFRDAKSLIYGLGIIEIFLRLITFLKYNIKIPEVNNILDKYVPENIVDIFSHYSSGLLYEILKWSIFICMVWFLVYLVKYFFKRK